MGSLANFTFGDLIERRNHSKLLDDLRELATKNKDLEPPAPRGENEPRNEAEQRRFLHMLKRSLVTILGEKNILTTEELQEKNRIRDEKAERKRHERPLFEPADDLGIDTQKFLERFKLYKYSTMVAKAKLNLTRNERTRELPTLACDMITDLDEMDVYQRVEGEERFWVNYQDMFKISNDLVELKVMEQGRPVTPQDTDDYNWDPVRGYVPNDRAGRRRDLDQTINESLIYTLRDLEQEETKRMIDEGQISIPKMVVRKIKKSNIQRQAEEWALIEFLDTNGDKVDWERTTKKCVHYAHMNGYDSKEMKEMLLVILKRYKPEEGRQCALYEVNEILEVMYNFCGKIDRRAKMKEALMNVSRPVGEKIDLVMRRVKAIAQEIFPDYEQGYQDKRDKIMICALITLTHDDLSAKIAAYVLKANKDNMRLNYKKMEDTVKDLEKENEVYKPTEELKMNRVLQRGDIRVGDEKTISLYKIQLEEESPTSSKNYDLVSLYNFDNIVMYNDYLRFSNPILRQKTEREMGMLGNDTMLYSTHMAIQQAQAEYYGKNSMNSRFATKGPSYHNAMMYTLNMILEKTYLARQRMRRDRKSTRLNSSHVSESRMPSSA